MESYIPMIDLQRHRNEARNHVLERNHPATQRHRCNFRISLESLWLASSSDSTQPRRGGNINGETTMRQSDFKSHRLGDEHEVSPKEEPWYERHMKILDPKTHRAKRGKRPKESNITAIVDYKETVQSVPVDANELNDSPAPYRTSFSRREHCSFRINNRSATPKFFTRSNSKHTWRSRGGTIPYTGNILLPKIHPNGTTFKISNNDSPHSRLDITIAATPRERLFVPKPTHQPQRNSNSDRRKLPSLDVQHRGSHNPNDNNNDRKRINKNSNSNSLEHDEEHISSFIKVSVTIANAVTPEGSPSTSTDAHSLQQQESKASSDHFTSEVLSGYSNTKEFIESTNRLHTPPRPHIIPISSNVKNKEISCEPYLKIEPLEKRNLSTVGEEDVNNVQRENASCSTSEQEESKIAVAITKKEKASQTTSIKSKHLTKTKKTNNKEIPSQKTQKDVQNQKETKEKASDPVATSTLSARSYESRASGDRGVASSVESDMLTTYQRQRLASIWRNTSPAAGNKASTGYTPSVESQSVSGNGSQDHSLASFLSTAQCAVRHFPVRESRRLPQDRGIFKRRLGRIIPRIKSLDQSSVVEDSNVSFEDDQKSDEEPQKEPMKFVECVNVASMILKKKRKKRKPTVYLPKVTVKKSKKRLKGDSAVSKDSSTTLPPLPTKSHPHTHSKDCKCNDCGKKRVKKGKSNKSPRIKGLPKIEGASSRKFNSLSDEGDHSCDILDRFTDEADRLLWVSEQQSEKLYVYPGYVPPRIILLSSKLGKLNSAREMIRKDTKGLLLIPYDFENWSFTDLLDSISQKLKEYHFGSRAKSILFLCQGGPGYAYILKNFVVTPQKLKRKDYKPLVQFLKLLGALMSKVNPEDTAIHFLGFNMTFSKQGRELVRSVRKCTLPNIVKVESPLENSIEERTIAKLYFDHKAFMAWKAEEKEEDEPPRSWSALAV